MEQLDHLIEILIQIVLVEHKYGLEAWSDARRNGGKRRILKSIAKAENTHLLLCPRKVPHIVHSQSPPI